MDRYYIIDDSQGTYYLVECRTNVVVAHSVRLNNFIAACMKQENMTATIFSTIYSQRKRHVNLL